MLSQEQFLKGLEFIKANYIKWEFDFNNDFMIMAWYKKLSFLSEREFKELLVRFTDTRKFPPNSPADILELYREEEEALHLSPNEAWCIVLGLLREHGFVYGREQIYEKLADKPILLRTVKEFEADLRYLEITDTYTPERFKKAYATYVKREVMDKCDYMRLPESQRKLLDSGDSQNEQWCRPFKEF